MSWLCYDVTVGFATLTALANVVTSIFQCRDSNMMSSMLPPCYDVATLLLVLRLQVLMS